LLGGHLARGGAEPLPMRVERGEKFGVLGGRCGSDGAYDHRPSWLRLRRKRSRHRLDALRAGTLPARRHNDDTAVNSGALTTLAQACRAVEGVEFGYTDATGTNTERHVEPHRLVSLGQCWYLVAYDLTRHDWRSFRLDRLATPRRTGVPFRQRQLPATDAAAFVRTGVENRSSDYRAELSRRGGFLDAAGEGWGPYSPGMRTQQHEPERAGAGRYRRELV